MFKKIFLISSGVICFLFIPFRLYSYDTLWARKFIRSLCSPKYHGRGYYKNGVLKASGLLIKHLKKSQTKPLFGSSYILSFTHPVNIFHRDPILIINGKKLIPGRDFIVDPSFPAFSLDTFFQTPIKNGESIRKGVMEITIKIQNKLTWSVATSQQNNVELNILKNTTDTLIHSIRIQVHSRVDPAFSEKIIGGYHPGSTDTMIVFTAHYDHLGRLGPSALFAGANDNASGTSMVALMSRYFHPAKRHSSKYKLVYIFFPAEEAGLLGSKFFTDNPPVDLSKIKFLINLDLLGTGEDGIMVVNATEFKREFELLNNINNEFRMVKNIRSRGPAANSDHYWFYKKGVPCFFIYTLGGSAFYHDIYDLPASLSLYAYENVFNLLISFIQHL